MVAVLMASACAHDSKVSNLQSNIRQLGKDIGKLMQSTNNNAIDATNDPTSFHARVHEQVTPLRERLEKLRDRTNTEVDKDDANGKDASTKEENKRDKLNGELDQMESQLNSVEVPLRPAHLRETRCSSARCCLRRVLEACTCSCRPCPLGRTHSRSRGERYRGAWQSYHRRR